MLNLDFFFWNYTILFIYVYGEIFFKLIFVSIFKNLKFLNKINSKKLQNNFFKNNVYLFTLVFLLVYFLTLKTNYSTGNLLSILLLLLILVLLAVFYCKSNFLFLFFNIFYLLFFSTYINSIILFFLFIELYAILFYFIFLNDVHTNTSFDVLKLKNALLLYLISNFITTIFLLIGLIYTVSSYGTTHFTELNFIATSTNNSPFIVFIVIGFLLKLGLPMLHFLKLEIYKYLDISFVIIFSIITLLLNYFLVINFLNYGVFNLILIKYKIVYILLFFNLVFLAQKLKLSNFNEFIAYSGFTTNNLILINFLVIIVITN